ncbi:MAG: NADH-quinone oxidoreductase subunit J, partial [Anaerolineales bacterium]|nr:NADH-quinone oxidoreductase subunit J [Anaerolineales bacterium]
MLTRIEDFGQLSDHPQWPIGAGIGGLLFFLMALAIGTTQVRTESERTGVEFNELGNILFTEWAIPFEVASLVLLVALIGAVILVKVSGERN